MNEWNIQSRARACQTCSKAFVDKATFHTLLLEQKQQLLRLDVCTPCWQSQFKEGKTERKGFISYWHGIFEVPPPPPPDAILKKDAESLLRRLIEQHNPRYGAACYILAVMLERKRLLKVKEQIRREGRRYFIYEQPKSGDLFTILDPDLQLNQLEAVQHDVADLLENGLPAAPGEIATAGTPAAQPVAEAASDSMTTSQEAPDSITPEIDPVQSQP